ncbi:MULTISPECIES: GntG family PLP-dependent aldolase [unclassified Streptomyces]|uniref:GntG family PLP-dependent aldolase n=1 Tax=unclassified Streptomyces TaxID=2593676 RepID=UPI000DB8FBF3|nr:GntG family PLP-dependent aldolase [Streptomyces sp. PsTaAH-137]MYT68252.1 threonine aldolase [Streptomyces sp. SID8367]RAJ76884.1 L-threonine aldolase [Streptomyces sp. PsTaAH-137]
MSHVVELRSDTFTLPTPRMLEAAAAAPLGDDVYGEDPTVAELEELSAKALGKQAGCLMPSGTMANLAALLTHSPRGGKAVVGSETDLYVYEAGGASVFGGIVYEPLTADPDGTLPLAAIAEAFDVDRDDPQFALPAVLCLETPHNRLGGIPLDPGYLTAAGALAHEHGVALHLDGARVFNAALALGVPAADLAAPADTVQFCLSKGLSAPVGSVLVGDERSIATARRYRKMLGGGMRQAGLIAACGILALTEMTDRLVDDHAHARRLADGLATVPGLLLDPEPPRTNMVFFTVDPEHTPHTTESLIEAARVRGVRLAELGRGRVRAVTHRGVTAADVDRAVSVLGDVMADKSGAPGARG